MGVGFNVGGESVGAHWSYSGFDSFRRKIARTAGIDLGTMEGFFQFDREKVVAEKGWEGLMEAMADESKRGKTSWDTIDDPIKFLLHHSDCDGELSPEACAQVAPRLRELVASWENTWKLEVNSEARAKLPHYPAVMELENYDKVNALRLADGMDKAAESRKPLEFC